MNRRTERDFRRFRTRGDSAALGRVFDATAPELARLARYLVRDAAGAEDVLQATFVTAMEKAATYREGSGIVPWLTGILARHAAKHRRRAAQVPDPARIEMREVPDPAAAASEAELAQLVEDHVGALPETYVSAVRWHLTDGRSARDVGAALGISASAASVRLHRGLKLLRERLQREAPQVAAPAAFVLPLASMREALVATGAAHPMQLGTSALGTSTPSAVTSTGVLMSKQSLSLVALGLLLGSGATQLAHIFASDRGVAGTKVATPVEREVLSPRATEREEASTDLVRIPLEVASVGGSTSDVEEKPAEPVAVDWLALLNGAAGEREARRVLDRIASLPDGAGAPLLVSLWEEIEPEHSRRPAADVFLKWGHSGSLAVADCGVADPVFQVQNGALAAVSMLAMEDLVSAAQVYAPWRKGTAGKTLKDVLVASARRFAGKLRQLSDEDLVNLLKDFDHYPTMLAERFEVDLAGVLVDHGLRDGIARLMSMDHDDAFLAVRRMARELDLSDVLLEHASAMLDGPDPESRVQFLRLLRYTKIPEDFAKSQLLPIVRSFATEDPSTVAAVATLLGKGQFLWATDSMTDAIKDPRIHGSNTSSFHFGSAFAEMGDPRAIPALIAIIAAHNESETVYGLGYFALSKLTGVPYEEDHDGAFWLDWWSENRDRLGPEVAGLSLPSVTTGER